MATRGTLKTSLQILLGVEDDDPAYSDTILESVLQEAYDGLLADIVAANPQYLQKTGTFTATSSTSRTYNIYGTATDFAKWIQVRETDENGALLRECKADELLAAGLGYFTLTGPDHAVVLTTSPDTNAGITLWMRYGYWPAAFTSDSSEPDGIPTRFHYVVALEAVFGYGLGGEARLPPEIRERWVNRRGQLMAHVGRRGVQPSRTRRDQDDVEF